MNFLVGNSRLLIGFNGQLIVISTTAIDLSDMPSLEDDDKVKKGKLFKNLTLNKLLTRHPILLAQIKAGNNSYKLRHEIKQIINLLYQHNKITQNVYNNLIKSL